MESIALSNRNFATLLKSASVYSSIPVIDLLGFLIALSIQNPCIIVANEPLFNASTRSDVFYGFLFTFFFN